MSLTGIDTSSAQIERARRAACCAGLHDVQFAVSTLASIDHSHKYDSILIHAVLHHLSEADIEELLGQARALLGTGGRLYIYEPLKSKRSSVLLTLIAIAVFLAVWSPWWVLHELGVRLKVGPPAFRNAVRRGWTGFSPDERSLDREWLLEKLEEWYRVEKIRYWHAYSLALAMGCSELRPPLSWTAELLVCGLNWLDQRLLRTHFRDHILGVWSFASICATVEESTTMTTPDVEGEE